MAPLCVRLSNYSQMNCLNRILRRFQIELLGHFHISYQFSFGLWRDDRLRLYLVDNRLIDLSS